MLTNRKKVLVLPGWYPNRLDPFTGDFIQRHVQCIAPHCEQQVIFVVKDEKGRFTKDVLEERNSGIGYAELIIFYHIRKTGLKWLDQFRSHRKYIELYKKAISKYIDCNGIPAFNHVHVAMKAGLPALWMKRKYSVPYVLSEHWTAYLPEAKPNLSDFGITFNKILKRVVAGASKLTVVSGSLGDAMVRYAGAGEFTVIPNVVNTGIFHQAELKPHPVTKLIHISNMDYQKNTEAILEALAMVKQKGCSFQLDLFGPVHETLTDMVKKLKLENEVIFHGEVPQPALAAVLQQSDLLLLYSRYETFGCVIIEANAAGVPVMLSDLTVFHELVEEGVNGTFVKQGDPKALAAALVGFIGGKFNFDRNRISSVARSRYNYENIGLQFLHLYKEAGFMK